MTDINLNDDFDNVVPKESNYLQKTDVGGQGVDLTISGFDRQNVSPNGVEMKVVMQFSNADYKPMILNQTNKNLIKSLGYATPAQAIGKTINVYNDPTITFGGQVTGGLRIRSPQQTQQPTAAPASYEDTRQDIDWKEKGGDNVPF